CVDAQQLLSCPYKDVAAALVRQAGLHEGVWAVFFEFGIAATNIADQSSGKVTPTAIIPVVRMGLRRSTTVDELSVDAAEVNPGKATPKRAPKRPRKKKEG